MASLRARPRGERARVRFRPAGQSPQPATRPYLGPSACGADRHALPTCPRTLRRLRPAGLEQLRAVHQEMVEAVLHGEGMERVAVLASGARGAAGRDRRALRGGRDRRPTRGGSRARRRAALRGDARQGRPRAAARGRRARRAGQLRAASRSASSRCSTATRPRLPESGERAPPRRAGRDDRRRARRGARAGGGAAARRPAGGAARGGDAGRRRAAQGGAARLRPVRAARSWSSPRCARRGPAS